LIEVLPELSSKGAAGAGAAAGEGALDRLTLSRGIERIERRLDDFEDRLCRRVQVVSNGSGDGNSGGGNSGDGDGADSAVGGTTLDSAVGGTTLDLAIARRLDEIEASVIGRLDRFETLMIDRLTRIEEASVARASTGTSAPSSL
jgi:hypothetical protein